MLKKLIHEESIDAKKNKLKEIKRYFSLIEVLIRHFYSHGWLNIFPIICLKNKNIWNNISLRYVISGKDNSATDIKLRFFDFDKFNYDLIMIVNEYYSQEQMNEFLNFEESEFDITKSNMMRNLLRRISLSENIQENEYVDYPKEIHIYNIDTNEPIILSEEVAFNKINDFINIINEKFY